MRTKRKSEKEKARAAIYERANFSFIRYGSVWEDADVLCDALEPAAKGGRLLSIGSAGDNALALLTLDPEDVLVVDVNPAQLACLELRVAAFRRLAEAELLEFLGVDPSERRLRIYSKKIREYLRPEARHYWDSHPRLVARGVIHAGKFERYLRMFRRWVLPFIHPERRIRQVRTSKTPTMKQEFYERTWDTPRWRWAFRFFFGPKVMGRFGRDPEFFAQVSGEVPIADRLLARTRHALTELPVQSNPYLAYILTGTYPPEARPRYLRPEWIRTIRKRLDRLRWVEGSVDQMARGRFDGFNLSNIFEYVGPEEHERLYTAMVERANPGARLVYWNLLVPRSCPPALADRVDRLETLAGELHDRDLAWFYEAVHVDEVRR